MLSNATTSIADGSSIPDNNCSGTDENITGIGGTDGGSNSCNSSTPDGFDSGSTSPLGMNKVEFLHCFFWV